MIFAFQILNTLFLNESLNSHTKAHKCEIRNKLNNKLSLMLVFKKIALCFLKIISELSLFYET